MTQCFDHWMTGSYQVCKNILGKMPKFLFPEKEPCYTKRMQVSMCDVIISCLFLLCYVCSWILHHSQYLKAWMLVLTIVLKSLCLNWQWRSKFSTNWRDFLRVRTRCVREAVVRTCLGRSSTDLLKCTWMHWRRLISSSSLSHLIHRSRLICWNTW